MSAIVARSAVGRRGFAPGGRAARVTHALLVIAVTVVPPGVRGSCSACPAAGGPPACCGGPPAAAAPACAAAAVAATHCCGSHASADPGMPTDASSAARVPEISMADAADGGPHSRGRCGCWLTAHDRGTAGPVPRPVATGAAFPGSPAIATAVVMPTVRAVGPDAAAFAPPRPIRVLYGVWRI